MNAATQSRPGTRPSILRESLDSPAFLLFVLFAGIYSLTSAGRLPSADGKTVAETAIALVAHLSIGLPPGPDTVPGVGGYNYDIYGIGQSLVEIPFVVAGLVLRHLTHNTGMVYFAISYTNAFVTALACALFYQVVRLLGASPRRALAITLLYGLCTLAWPYAKTDFNEPLQTVGLLLAFYGALRARTDGRTRWLWLCGAGLGLAILTKSALGLAVPAFVVYIASQTMPSIAPRAALQTLRRRGWWGTALRREAYVLAPVVVAVAITLGINAIKFGSPLDNGYSRAVNGATLIGPLPWGFFAGLFGLLFSFNTGIIFYATPVLLSLAGLRAFFRVCPRETVFVGVLVVPLLALYSGYKYWAGLAAFGPRYLVPFIPFLLLPLVFAFPGLLARPREHVVGIACIAGAALVGLVVQLFGITVAFDAYSALTCVQFPCPASLDASQSELLYDIWLLRDAIAYCFLGQPPHIVLASYPFGAPPVGRPAWPRLLSAELYYFWFDALPNVRVAAMAIGGVGLGGLIAATAVRLAQLAGLTGAAGPRAAAREPQRV